MSFTPLRQGLVRPRQKWALLLQRVIHRLVISRITDGFFRILGGHIFFQYLRAAVEVDLFGALALHGPLTETQLRDILGLEERPARVLLLGCTVSGLIRKRGDHYRNGTIAKRYLHKNAKRNIISMVKWQHHINYYPMFDFLDSLKVNSNIGLRHIAGEGTNLFERLHHRPELEDIFYSAMREQAENLSLILTRFVDFGRVSHLLDVGGGAADYAIQIAKHWPSLRISILDLPSVCSLADNAIAAHDLGHQIRTVPGDCFADNWTAGADGILFAHFLTLWSPDRCLELLRKAHAALPAGGSVVIFNIMQNKARTGPLSSALGSAYFITLATGESFLYTIDEYRAWVLSAGFSRVETMHLPHDHVALIGVK